MSDNNKHSSAQIPVGLIACQKDTFAQEVLTVCIECTDKPNKQGFYEIKLQDTGKSHRIQEFFISQHFF